LSAEVRRVEMNACGDRHVSLSMHWIDRVEINACGVYPQGLKWNKRCNGEECMQGGSGWIGLK
jgi:hypothetical protein